VRNNYGLDYVDFLGAPLKTTIALPMLLMGGGVCRWVFVARPAFEVARHDVVRELLHCFSHR